MEYVLQMGIGPKTPYPRDSNIPQIFEQMVQSQGDHLALKIEEGEVTYAELNAKANQIAHHLVQLGVKKGEFVGISLDRSVPLIAGVLGILKAGGVYVPIDQSYPIERKLLVIEDANLKILLTQDSFANQFPQDKLKLVCLDSETFPETNTNLKMEIGPLDVAYLNYTSGSTGKPKGVEVCHRGVIRLVKNTNWIEITPKDRFLQISNISFDATTFEIWGALLNGAALHIFPVGDFSPEQLGSFLKKEKITHLLLTSRLFTVMIEERLDSLKGLRYFLAGGDVFPAKQGKIAFQALPDCQLINAYGPTENATITTTYSIKDLQSIEEAVPIGRPISNTTVYILDAHQKPVAIGVPGELCTGGDGLARGYLNQKELTDEKFIPNPFGEGKLYRTGDLVAYLPDGNILFLGRIDNQVKIRGFRIELGEIEEVVRHHPVVADCIALAREDSPGDKRLVCYIEFKKGKEATPEELRDYCARKLPGYMVPQFFVFLNQFPLSLTGKVDRKALPAPVIGIREKGDFKSPFEKKIAQIWMEVLHLDHVAPHDHFFKMGGDSINAMQMISRLKNKENIDASVHMLFERPLLTDFATYIENQQELSKKEKIEKRKIHSPVATSLNQSSLWLVDQLMPGAIAYSLPFIFQMKGELDVPTLKKALEMIVQRHESLRTHFIEKEGDGVQVIEDQIANFFHFSKEKKAQAHLEQKAAVCFHLKKSPLFHFEIIETGPKEYLCLFNIHHIIFDGWSSEVFFKEWSSIYSSLIKKKPINLPELPIQYGDFAVWQRKYLSTEPAKKQLEYWKNRLQGAPELFELPWDQTRPTQFTGKGDTIRRELSCELSSSLWKLAKKRGVTPFVLFFAAYNVLLHRYSGKTDLVIGVPYANRNRHELEPLIGYFVQMFAIRSDLSDNPPFFSFLEQVNQTVLDSYTNGDIPIEMLVAELNPNRNRSYNPLFQVGFAFQNIVQRFLQIEGIKGSWVPFKNQAAILDLHLNILEEENKLICSFEYCTDLFEKETLQRMLKNYETLLKNIVKNPEQRVSLLPLLTPQEIHQITVEWNDTIRTYPKEESIPTLFEKISEENRHHPALRFKGKIMTYQELNEKANQFARHLQEKGVQKGNFVGITLDRSFELIIGLLGILKAGAAYVPIDASYPEERKKFMVEDTDIQVHVTGKTFEEQKAHSTKNLDLKIAPLDLAYINYTSGSTGRPKGVEVMHQGILRHIKNSHFFECTPADRALHMASISFDATTTEVWGTLLNGGCLCIFPQNEFSVEDLGKFLVEEKITYALFTARLFNLLVEQQLSSLKNLRYLVSVGEAMSVPHANIAFEELPNCQIVNAYGPTENTACTTVFVLSNQVKNYVPIGRPIGNTQVYLLDSQMQPVPIGVQGEIYTGGDGVAKGYLNRPDLTAEKFVPNPFGPGKLYRTGDLAKFLPDGNLVYLGRMDHQVKIRGFRIELGEIEDVLRHHEAVADCIAIAREDVPGEKVLVAYVEPKEGQSLTSEKIQKHAASKLPKYMLPTFFMILEHFPLTANGKIDRKALPSPAAALESRAFEPPKTPTEVLLAEIWSELLKISKVGRQDHFFHLGGHSIAAAQLASVASQALNIKIPVGIIFEDSILEKYAKKIDQIQMQGDVKGAVTTSQLFWIWRNKDAVLDPAISPEGPPPRLSQYEAPQKIFLTGATGFVGAFFLRELIEKTEALLYCHARAKTEGEAFDRIKENLDHYLIWKPEYTKRLIGVPGDLEKELLGMTPQQFDFLAQEIDSIFHIGAFVNHALPYQKLRAANVYGTQEALRLACKTQMKPFHFVSTVATLEPKGAVVEEDTDIRESKNLFNGYGQSKWVGEKLVLIARSRGLPASIYRLARVSGDSRVGSGPTSDFLWRMMQACVRLKMAPQIDYREEVTPVDYVCAAIQQIAKMPQQINGQYHTLNSQAYSYKNVFKFFKHLGYSLEMTDFQTWRHELVHEAMRTGEEPLRALMPLFAELDLSSPAALITYSNRNVFEALKNSKIECPKVDEKLFKKYIDYYVKIGFLPPYG